jgi:hypothetical protein
MTSEEPKLMAIFDRASAVADVVDSLHEVGIEDDQILIMTGVPYPERALGRHSEWLRLPQIVLLGGLGGLVLGLFLAVITPHLYRLDIGGHPPVGFPPAAVITFVFAMMATIIATFLGVLWEMEFPEFGPKYYNDLVTAGHLAMLVSFSSKQEDMVHKLLNQHGGQQIHRPKRKHL